MYFIFSFLRVDFFVNNKQTLDVKHTHLQQLLNSKLTRVCVFVIVVAVILPDSMINKIIQ